VSYPDYVSPATLTDALDALAAVGSDACVVAGGTDLLPQMRGGVRSPGLLVDLRRLPLRDIVQDGQTVTIGACVTHAQIAASGLLARHFPALVAACRVVGGPSIRNRGTLGGNLAHASPAADTAPPLLAYDAEVITVSRAGRRIIPLSGFFSGPGLTQLEPHEVILGVRLPIPPENTAAQFIKLGQRRAMAIAVASVAARLTQGQDGRITAARIALGSVAPSPFCATGAASLLQGSAASGQLIAEAAEQARAASSPISDIRASAIYRGRMVEVLTRRALTAARAELQGG